MKGIASLSILFAALIESAIEPDLRVPLSRTGGETLTMC
jgi:hypothetical protein